MFMNTWGPVGPGTAAEFPLALVEMGFELGPLGVAGQAVLFSGSYLPASLEEALVVADEVFFEDGDVTTGGFQVEVAEQGCADVDGQATVDQFRREQAPKIVRRKGNTSELRVGGGKVAAAALQHGADHAVG